MFAECYYCLCVWLVFQCYDLRFPALYTALAGMGAELLTVPSAFTVKTGLAHWEVSERLCAHLKRLANCAFAGAVAGPGSGEPMLCGGSGTDGAAQRGGSEAGGQEWCGKRELRTCYG